MFVIARNSKGRPMLQHKAQPGSNYTVCGYNLSGWSRFYMADAIPVILCKKCAKAGEL